MSIQLRGLHPQVRARAELTLEYANRFGVRPVVTSGHRSWHEQAELRRRFLAGESAFPANRPGDSAHNFGLAFDSVLPSTLRGIPRFERGWIAIRRAAGFEVPPNDLIHSQVPGWRRFVQQ